MHVTAQNKPIGVWLLLCCLMIALMVGIGGLTRLTNSGLSMTEWKPITGWLPPLNVEDWQAEFNNYQTSPEFKKINPNMDIEGFKKIFWLEYIHRVMGRVTGLVFLLPLIYFFVRKQVTATLALKLLGIFSIGALQGVIGWFMVKSGLKDNPQVSQYWLAFHLSTAFLIFWLVFWTALSSIMKPVIQGDLKYKGLLKFSVIISCAVFIQIVLGAFVAGTHAGFMYNTFPDMDGHIIPPDMWYITPWYKNIFENLTTIQFNHRLIAYVVSLAIIVFWFISRRFQLTNKTNYAIGLLVVSIGVQFTLGVQTLLKQVPVSLASLHQVMALIVFALSIWVTHSLANERDIRIK